MQSDPRRRLPPAPLPEPPPAPLHVRVELDWIVDRWQGDPSLPQDLLAILHRADARDPALT
jgi:hypothetical protein